ncbi:MAG TPA: hypothetical protein VFS39_17445 [Nitrospira sp.]|nr:hypothetical protein [Nitrospira sp.]
MTKEQDQPDRALSDILAELDSIRGQVKQLHQLMAAGDSRDVTTLATGLHERLEAVLAELTRWSDRVEKRQPLEP